MDIKTDHATVLAWLTLLRAPGLGPATLRELVDAHGGAATALDAARRGEHGRVDVACRDWLRAPDARALASDMAWLAGAGHALLTFDEADFPILLNEAPGPPAALFVAGDPTALWLPQVAIVGSRNASQGGIATAASFARALVDAGFAITSGLAEGIDAAAHLAALDAGGVTLAVLGTGPDRIYPSKNVDLAVRFAPHGALISEFPPGTPAHPSHFPRRNRIIAALSLGTLVVEAGVRSGSLITARNAGESGRDVFAIPGSIHNPLARGCHQLIRSGAKLVETAEDIITELAPLAHRLGARLRERLESPPAATHAVQAATTSPCARDPETLKLFAALGHDALGIDQLAERSGLAVGALSSMLLMLELEGKVVAERGGYALRVPG